MAPVVRRGRERAADERGRCEGDARAGKHAALFVLDCGTQSAGQALCAGRRGDHQGGADENQPGDMLQAR